MKKLFYILIFAIAFTLGSCNFAYSQTIELPRDVAEKALKSIELVPKLEAENSALRKQVAELENAKLTGCQILINNFSDIMLKLPMPASDNSKAENKAIFQLRKQTHDILRRSIQAECKWQSSPKWYLELLKIAPLAGAILLK